MQNEGSHITFTVTLLKQTTNNYIRIVPSKFLSVGASIFPYRREFTDLLVADTLSLTECTQRSLGVEDKICMSQVIFIYSSVLWFYNSIVITDKLSVKNTFFNRVQLLIKEQFLL